ncbi:GlxA family transcriptional regulator [Ruegeria sp. SCP11]|uniref:GlxA family transcriptional regulator n=1 Tax=Ruegeria sp. SCP11 TaxID=3141378 RepID=UPI003335503A
MEKWRKPTDFRKVSFLLSSPESLFEISAVIAVLHAANKIQESEVFDWEFLSVEGQDATTETGLSVSTSPLPSEMSGKQMIFCIGQEASSQETRAKMSGWLRRAWRSGYVIGAAGDGIHILAQAGLLEGKDFTSHWEHALSFPEKYGNLYPSEELFCFDGRLLTCGGGSAVIDLFLTILAREISLEFAKKVSDQLLSGRIRDGTDCPKMTYSARFNTRNSVLLNVLSEIREGIYEDLSIEALCERHSISRRQLERLFLRDTGMPPGQYIKDTRLRHGRYLLSQTEMTVAEVAAAIGFNSTGNFSASFKRKYGVSPSKFSGSMDLDS